MRSCVGAGPVAFFAKSSHRSVYCNSVCSCKRRLHAAGPLQTFPPHHHAYATKIWRQEPSLRQVVFSCEIVNTGRLLRRRRRRGRRRRGENIRLPRATRTRNAAHPFPSSLSRRTNMKTCHLPTRPAPRPRQRTTSKNTSVCTFACLTGTS